jgi:uncharacterized iron-regulated membrane protein
VGLVFCIPVTLLGVTGSVLVYEKAINDWFQPPPQAFAQGKPRSAQAIIDAAATARPDFRPVTLMSALVQGDAAIVYLAPKDPARRSGLSQAFVDPVSLRLLEFRENIGSPFFDAVHSLHTNMMLGEGTGRAMVGWFGLGMTILGLSGLAIWWPRRGCWHGAYGIKRGARGWLFHRQVHGTVGVTAWIIFLILSVSGVVLSFPIAANAAIRALSGYDAAAFHPPARRSGTNGLQPADSGAQVNADSASTLAQGPEPRTHVSMIFLPNAPGQMFRINLLPDGATADAQAITVLVDSNRARILGVRDPWARGTGSQVINWQWPLHTGRGTQALYRAVIFLVGLLPILFAVTGVSMWWIKRQQARRGM